MTMCTRVCKRTRRRECATTAALLSGLAHYLSNGYWATRGFLQVPSLDEAAIMRDWTFRTLDVLRGGQQSQPSRLTLQYMMSQLQILFSNATDVLDTGSAALHPGLEKYSRFKFFSEVPGLNVVLSSKECVAEAVSALSTGITVHMDTTLGPIAKVRVVQCAT